MTAFDVIDNSPVTKFHRKLLIACCGGPFLDGYIISLIGVALIGYAHVRIRRNGKDRDLSFEEDNAFWTWALVETLRHTGARIEEVLELVHMSIQPYKVPGTGETIPLLHFATPTQSV